jgi:hypothetical protein
VEERGITLFRSITMLCGVANIPQNILGYFPYLDGMWEMFGNIPWNMVGPT